MITKILTITSIAVLATFIMTMAMVNDAQAHNPVLDPEEFDEDIADFKCDENFGSFYDPFIVTTNPNDVTAAFGVVVAGSWADCSVIGQAGLTSFLLVTDDDPDDGCVQLASPPESDSFLVNEKGFISFSTAGEQCFFDSEGDPLDEDPGEDDFCGGAGTAHTSELVGEYTMTDGLVDGKRVVGGSGATHSTANHCDKTDTDPTRDLNPFANSGTSSFHGDIHTIDEDDDDDDND